MAVQVTAWLDRNWFTLLIALFLLGMTLDGHRRGFLRLTVSALALILTTLFARVALPSTAGFWQKHGDAGGCRAVYYRKDRLGHSDGSPDRRQRGTGPRH